MGILFNLKFCDQTVAVLTNSFNDVSYVPLILLTGLFSESGIRITGILQAVCGDILILFRDDISIIIDIGLFIEYSGKEHVFLKITECILLHDPGNINRVSND